MLRFNMNKYVYFKPTELGKQVYKDFHQAHSLNIELEVNGEGFSKLQFHEFIWIYGSFVTSYVSKDKKVFDYYEFYIDEGDLL